MADLRFDADTMRLCIKSTKGLLNQGTAVRGWLITASDPTQGQNNAARR